MSFLGWWDYSTMRRSDETTVRSSHRVCAAELADLAVELGLGWPLGTQTRAITRDMETEPTSAIEAPTKQDFALAIDLLKQHGMAAIGSAALHGGGAETERLADAAESVARVVAYLRIARDNAR